VQVDSYLEQIEHNADLLLRAARMAGLDARVPSCPQWRVLGLLQHVTKIHHWATAIISGVERSKLTFEPPAEDEIYAVFAAGCGALLAALRSAPDNLQAWTMFPSTSPRLFWARRQAHETTIHRVDAELAADFGVTEIATEFAKDGLDELLCGMIGARISAVDLPRSFTMTVTPLDANAAWTVTASPQQIRCEPLARDFSDLNVFGLAADLYRWAWHRAGDDEVALRGDMSVADTWRSHFTV
jgi:uncharacterized protein (TIGR03083 family)